MELTHGSNSEERKQHAILGILCRNLKVSNTATKTGVYFSLIGKTGIGVLLHCLESVQSDCYRFDQLANVHFVSSLVLCSHYIQTTGITLSSGHYVEPLTGIISWLSF